MTLRRVSLRGAAPPLGTWAAEANTARAHNPSTATARFAAQLRRDGRLREPSRIGLVAGVKLVLTRLSLVCLGSRLIRGKMHDTLGVRNRNAGLAKTPPQFPIQIRAQILLTFAGVAYPYPELEQDAIVFK